MERLQQNDFAVKTLVHDGWTLCIRAKVADGGAGLLGSADISRDGASHYRLTASEAFDTRQQLIAVMVAKADKWVALQGSFASRAF